MEIAWLQIYNPEHIHGKGERHSSYKPSFGRVESEGWEVRVQDHKSRLCKSVGWATSLPSSSASLLAAAVPRPSMGKRTPCNDTGCPTGSVGIAWCQQNLLGKQDRVQISHSTFGRGEVQKERRLFQHLGWKTQWRWIRKQTWLVGRAWRWRSLSSKQIKSQDLKSMVDHRGNGGRPAYSLQNLKVKSERVSKETLLCLPLHCTCLQYT